MAKDAVVYFFLNISRNTAYLKRLKNISLSLGSIFHFIITAEYEWDNIKRIAYGKRYDLPLERITSMLVLETE